MSLAVILAQSNQESAESLAQGLKASSYEVDIAINGKDCQLKVYKKKYLAVVLDLDIRDHSGLEVLKYLRLNYPSLKVILTFPSKERQNEFFLDKQDLLKLGASDILIMPFTAHELMQSIEGVGQFETWKSLRANSNAKNEVEVEAQDEEFTRIKIEDFFSGNTTIFDHYIRLGPNKYVKILHKGDFFEEGRIKKYAQQKDVGHLYFKTEERSVYINFINQLLAKLVNENKEPVSKKVKVLKNVAEKYLEEVSLVGLKPQLVDEGKKICQNMYKLVQRDRGLAGLLAMYKDYDPPAYSHIFLVSLLSAVSCQNLEWASQRTTELIAFGALFHDIGMLKLPPEINELNFANLTAEQKDLFYQHPQMGSEILRRYPIVPEPVHQIIYQHHEYMNGLGFPNALSGVHIYPLAKVVSLAEEFVNFIMLKKISPLEGLRLFIQDKEKRERFDPLIIKALVKGFCDS